jgi:topoisomerase IA-like protein
LYSGRYGAYREARQGEPPLPDQGAIGVITLVEAKELVASKSGKKPKAKPKAAKAGKPRMKRAAEG